MCKILYIKSNNSSDDNSITFRVSDNFISEYSKCHPNDEITVLDLNKEKIRSLNKSDILDAIVHKNDDNKNHPLLKFAYQFIESDKYIIADPIENSSITNVLNYLDYVGIMDFAYKYTDCGPVGLLKGKKAINIAIREGENAESTGYSDFGEEYLKSIFQCFGITDFMMINSNKIDKTKEDKNAVLAELIEDAKVKAKYF